MMKFMILGFAFFLLSTASLILDIDSTVLAQNDKLIDLSVDRPDNITRHTTAFDDNARGAVIRFIDFLLSFVGVICTAVIIYGGFLYITSGGDDGNTEKAKKIIIFGIVGILVILASFAIVHTVIMDSGMDTRPD